MIAIINIDKNLRQFGVHDYQIKINSMDICQFKHKREDGLAACLLAASKAVEENKWANSKHLFFPDDK